MHLNKIFFVDICLIHLWSANSLFRRLLLCNRIHFQLDLPKMNEVVIRICPKKLEKINLKQWSYWRWRAYWWWRNWLTVGQTQSIGTHPMLVEWPTPNAYRSHSGLSFTIVHRACRNRLLQFTKTIAINRLKLVLYNQKELFASLYLFF